MSDNGMAAVFVSLALDEPGRDAARSGPACWDTDCNAAPKWTIEPMEGSPVYMACGDPEHVVQALLELTSAKRTTQVVVQAW